MIFYLLSFSDNDFLDERERDSHGQTDENLFLVCVFHCFHLHTQAVLMFAFGGASVAGPEGVQGVCSNPPPNPTFLNIL